MKVNIEVECTPEEARRAVGLPDLAPVHERYVAMMVEAMSGTMPHEMIEGVMRSWAPLGEAGLSAWRRLFDATGKADG